MNYIKFDTINSTNDFLKSYSKTTDLPDFFYVYTDFQESGRGQGSNVWQSVCCKNVLMSVFLRPGFELKEQAILSRIIALSIIKVLQKFNIHGLQIKLPNDIMADRKKIAGILIENQIAQNRWKSSIIGIGLNVNQTDFVNLPEATSVKKITGVEFEPEMIVHQLVEEIKKQYVRDADELKQEFEKLIISMPKQSSSSSS